MTLVYEEAREEKLTGLECRDGAQDFLDQLYGIGTGSGFALAKHLVGTGAHNSGVVRQLVDRIPQRLVLNTSVLPNQQDFRVATGKPA